MSDWRGIIPVTHLAGAEYALPGLPGFPDVQVTRSACGRDARRLATTTAPGDTCCLNCRRTHRWANAASTSGALTRAETDTP
jgi:hypothetical protein